MSGLNTLTSPFSLLSVDDINAYFNNKVERLDDFCHNHLNRTLTMFRYNGLPEELKEKDVETIRQTMGFGMFTYKDGKTYALNGKFVPPVNYLYQNTGFIVTNPWIDEMDGVYKLVNVVEATKGLENLTEGKEGVLFRNDPLCRGLYPLFVKYGIMSLENDITMRLASINLRQFILMVAKDDNTVESAQLFLQKIENGEQGVITDEAFGEEGFKGNPLNVPTTFVTQLIENAQYIKGSLFNELGLNANYNMKRERLSEGETEMNVDMLRPLPDIMLEERREDAKAYSDFTGGEVKWEVEFDSVWAKYNLPYSEAVENNAQEPQEEASEDSFEEVTDNEATEPEMTDTEPQEDNVEETAETVEEDTASEVEEVVEDIKEIVEEVAELAETSQEPQEEASEDSDDKNINEEETEPTEDDTEEEEEDKDENNDKESA